MKLVLHSSTHDKDLEGDVGKIYKDGATQEMLDVAPCLDLRFKKDFISADNKHQVKARQTLEITWPGDIKL